MIGTDPLEDFPAFATDVRRRIEQGALGEKSFSTDPQRLLEEISEELLDVCGWAYTLHCRLNKMRAALFFVQAQVSGTGGLGTPKIPAFGESVEFRDPFTGIVTKEPFILPPRGRMVDAEREYFPTSKRRIIP